MQHSSLRSTYLNRDGGAIPASVRRTRGHPLFVVSPHLDDAVFSCGMSGRGGVHGVCGHTTEASEPTLGRSGGFSRFNARNASAYT
jgi:hypothetical protein